MKHLALLILSLTALGFPAQAQDAPVATKSEFKAAVRQDVHLKYLVTLPEGYDADPEKKWPLLLFLHGAGERGDNLDQLWVHGPHKLLKNGTRTFDAVVISPQCPKDSWWNFQPLTELLGYLEETYRLDEDRLYLTGLSMGGYGTWDLAFRHPDKFAAIVPICGGGVRFGPRAITHLPTWVFHGAKDNVVPLSESETLVEIMKKRGAKNVQLTVYPEAGHDSWTAAYEDEEMWKWLFSQRKSLHKK